MSDNISLKEITTIDRIPFNFTYYAMKLLGRNLYSNPWTAISEIVANGIDAKAPNIYVLVDMRTKGKSAIEIFDSGHGMSYTDLCEKYTLIGRNKRLSDENIEGKTLGRKGIGKLAALYLSSKYYLITKTERESSAWCVDTTNIEDSEIPTLNRSASFQDLIIAKDQWQECKTGTMIHLTDVDLTNIGFERLKSLYAILTDYYIPDLIDSEISVCVLNQKDVQIEFKKLEKNILFETMCAIFDNTNKNYASRLPKHTYLLSESNVSELDSIKEETIILDVDKFQTNGTIPLTTVDGENIDAEYSLCGWIGIHSSLEKKVLERNYPKAKRLQQHPNALRLYVRGKLAVSNLMNYVASSQAFANYIEGEISFDILDDDRFEDASTSNREGYSLSDPRVVELIKVVKKIITTLIHDRVQMGSNSNSKRDAYFDKLRKEEERKKEEARKAQEEAERLAREAEDARKREEEKRLQAENEANKLKAQNNTIFNALTEEQESFSAKTHLVKTNAIAIRNSACTLAEKVGIDTYKEVGAIAISSDKILSSLKYSALAKFNLEDEYISEDLFVFCREYIETVLAKQYFHIKFEIEVTGEYFVRFNPQYVTLILDNFISNSEKSGATKFMVDMFCLNNSVIIEVADNGKGLGDEDLNRIFEFGFSNTGGTGIGLYNIKRAVAKMNGTISAHNNEFNGATFKIKI